MQPRRSKQAAKKFFRKLLKGLQYVPRAIITDKLRSYAAAKVEVMPSVEHQQQGRLNNRAENSYQPTWERNGGCVASSRPGTPSGPPDFRSDRVFFPSWTASTGGPKLPRDHAPSLDRMA